jgi:hypothetical protein
MTPAAFKRSIRDLQVWCSSCMVSDQARSFRWRHALVNAGFLAVPSRCMNPNWTTLKSEFDGQSPQQPPKHILHEFLALVILNAFPVGHVQ